MSDVITATGTCFQDALDFFEHLAEEDESVVAAACANLRLVHGICEMNKVRYCHAWVEEYVVDTQYRADWPKYVVWQGVMWNGRRAYVAMERDSFYTAFAVHFQTPYPIALVATLISVTGHGGPWNDTYMELMDTQPGGQPLGLLKNVESIGAIFVDGAS